MGINTIKEYETLNMTWNNVKSKDENKEKWEKLKSAKIQNIYDI